MAASGIPSASIFSTLALRPSALIGAVTLANGRSRARGRQRLLERRREPVDVLVAGRPVREGHTRRVHAVPRRAAQPGLAGALQLLDHARGALVVAVEAQQHLV